MQTLRIAKKVPNRVIENVTKDFEIKDRVDKKLYM